MIVGTSFTGWANPLFPPVPPGPRPGEERAGGAPDDDDDAVEDVVGVAQVIEEPEGGQLQEHLQGKHAGEDHVADLQDVGQLLGLWAWGRDGTVRQKAALGPYRSPLALGLPRPRPPGGGKAWLCHPGCVARKVSVLAGAPSPRYTVALKT